MNFANIYKYFSSLYLYAKQWEEEKRWGSSTSVWVGLIFCFISKEKIRRKPEWKMNAICREKSDNITFIHGIK